MSIARRIQQLSTLSDSSVRYKVARILWPQKVICRARFCKFYFLMLPLAFVTGLMMVLGWSILVLTSWVLGFTTTVVKDRGSNKQSADFYSYKYSPCKGRHHRFAPWEALSLAFVLVMLGTGRCWLLTKAIGMLVLTIAAIAAMIGLLKLSESHRWPERCSMFWHNFRDKFCPPLRIEHKESTPSRSG